MNCVVFNKNLKKSALLKKNIYIGEGVEIGKNVTIENCVCLEGNTKIGDNCVISRYTTILNSVIENNVNLISSNIENSTIKANCSVGPFAHIRNNSIIGKNNRIGNFVEIKNSKTGQNCKMAHLTYVGDAIMGDNCNIGCGVVFCNYNGEIKQQSILGNNVFVGSNVNIVAPVIIEDNAYIAAGSTINKNVLKNEFVIARARQENKTDFKNPYLKNKK